MNNHHGENWPYHENKHTGEMTPCANNPCKLHGGSDIMASSLEEAYEKSSEQHDGRGMGIDQYEREQQHERDIRRNDIVTEPAVNDPTGGYMGGHLFIGGRYDATKDKDSKEVAKLIRKDIKGLKENKDIPEGWKVSVRMDKGAWMSGYSVNVKYDENDAQASPYRLPTYDDIGNNRDANAAFIQANHDMGKTVNHEEYDNYVREHHVRMLKPEASAAIDIMMKAANQYGKSDTNGMVDYFSENRTASFNGFMTD